MNNTRNPKAIYAAKKCIQYEEQYLKTRSTWFYNILIAGAGLLGALVALSNNSHETYLVRFLFVATIITLTLGILSVTISLYCDTARAKQRHEASYKRLQNIIFDKKDDSTSSIRDLKLFSVFGVLSYIFFSLSFISLIIYVVLKNLPELL